MLVVWMSSKLHTVSAGVIWAVIRVDKFLQIRGRGSTPDVPPRNPYWIISEGSSSGFPLPLPLSLPYTKGPYRSVWSGNNSLNDSVESAQISSWLIRFDLVDAFTRKSDSSPELIAFWTLCVASKAAIVSRIFSWFLCCASSYTKRSSSGRFATSFSSRYEWGLNGMWWVRVKFLKQLKNVI